MSELLGEGSEGVAASAFYLHVQMVQLWLAGHGPPEVLLDERSSRRLDLILQLDQPPPVPHARALLRACSRQPAAALRALQRPLLHAFRAACCSKTRLRASSACAYAASSSAARASLASLTRSCACASSAASSLARAISSPITRVHDDCDRSRTRRVAIRRRTLSYPRKGEPCER